MKPDEGAIAAAVVSALGVVAGGFAAEGMGLARSFRGSKSSSSKLELVVSRLMRSAAASGSSRDDVEAVAALAAVLALVSATSTQEDRTCVVVLK